jgi:hypothetical protein
MKLVKNFVFAVVLVSALAMNTNAGDLETPGFVPPPPPPRAMSVSNPNEDESSLDYGAIAAETSDYLLFEAFAALLSVY